jgi:hypothetical protein
MCELQYGTTPSLEFGASLARLGPKKILIARLPVTGSNFFGREADIAFLEEAWANQHVNVVYIVRDRFWVGKKECR